MKSCLWNTKAFVWYCLVENQETQPVHMLSTRIQTKSEQARTQRVLQSSSSPYAWVDIHLGLKVLAKDIWAGVSYQYKCLPFALVALSKLSAEEGWEVPEGASCRTEGQEGLWLGMLRQQEWNHHHSYVLCGDQNYFAILRNPIWTQSSLTSPSWATESIWSGVNRGTSASLKGWCMEQRNS